MESLWRHAGPAAVAASVPGRALAGPVHHGLDAARLALQLLLRLPRGLLRVLHDQLRHVRDRRVVEDQGHGQVDAWERLRQRIAEQHGRVAGEPALHERRVELDVLIVADEALGNLQDLALEHGRVEACAEVDLHNLRLVSASRRALLCLLRHALLRHHRHLALLHRPLLHLPLLLHLLFLQVALLDLLLNLLDALQLRPGLVLAVRISHLLVDVDRLLPELPRLGDVPVVQADAGKQSQGGRLALEVAAVAEDRQRLVRCLRGLPHLAVHHLSLADGEEGGP
mmetsp:Transcript_65401/g.202781  ORF Transcript_65401/g.202781 Transcript_65401/m.202781 type:complete len:283 (+) Transcript_65401:49-897(+)